MYTVLCTLAYSLFRGMGSDSIPRLCQDVPLLTFSPGKKQNKVKQPSQRHRICP